jgi:hypothetical protein
MNPILRLCELLCLTNSDYPKLILMTGFYSLSSLLFDIDAILPLAGDVLG